MSSDSNAFALTWYVEMFHKNIFNSDECLESGFFVIESLKNTRWNLKLSCKAISKENWIMCDLNNGCAFVDSETVYFNYRLCIKVEGKRYFERVGRFIKSGPGCFYRIPFIHIHTLKYTHYPNDTLVVVCEIEPYQGNDTVADNLERLSKDIALLYVTKLHSDLILTTDDHRAFEAHKIIVACRWDEMISKIPRSESELNVDGVPGPVFEIFLRYLYSGKLKGSDTSIELYDFASQNCVDLRQDMRTLSNAWSMCTRFYTQRKVLKWHVGDLEKNSPSFFQVVPLREIYSPELMVNIDEVVLNSTDGQYLDISFWFPLFETDRPIFLRCHVLLEKGSGLDPIGFSKKHVFVRGEEWHFPSLVKMSYLAGLSSFRLILTLDIGDRLLPPTVKTSRTEFQTGSRDVCNLRSLARDLHRTSKDTTFKDLLIIIKDKGLFCHRAILSARSSVFRKLLQRNTVFEGIPTIHISPIDTLPVFCFLDYIYSGRIGYLSREDVSKLKGVSESLHMPKLEKFCDTFLASN